MKLALPTLFVCVFVAWIAASQASPLIAAQAGAPTADGAESAADEPPLAPEPAVDGGEGDSGEDAAACALSSSCCESCVGESCATCGGACSFFDPPSNACGVDPRIYRSLILGRLWVEAEYLAWACSSTHLPPLVTTSDPGTAQADAGVLGKDNTAILFGNADYHGDFRSGGRLSGGYWFTPEHRTGIEGSFFQVDGGDVEFLGLGDGTNILARPIVDAVTGSPAAILVSYPGLQLGDLAVKTDMGLLGAEALLRRALREGSNYRIDGVVGYRYQRLFDRLAVDEAYDLARPAGSVETISFYRFDDLVSKNQFHGGEAGLIGRWWGCRWAFQALGKVALGGTRTSTTIGGGTIRTVTNDDPDIDPVETFYAGGVLALPSNIGSYGRTEFAAVGELGLRLEYALNKQCRLTAGYTVIYWPNVARVTDSIDRLVDSSQIPPAANPSATSPSFAFQDSDFWAQGVSAGLHIEF